MKRILFVDDEPRVLQGLRRMLHSMRHEWTMEFAESGREALDMLAKAPYDVVVTDMRMPGMDGAQLLKEVMKRYPDVVRIILSGQTDQDTFLSSTTIMHRFLSKPCDTELLKGTIEDACRLKGLLKDELLKKLVMQTGALPSLSNLYAEIIKTIQSPNVHMEKIGRIISKDIGMTAKILQLVNSAFYGLRRRISDPAEAAVVLGINTMKALVLSHSLFSSLNQVKINKFSPTALWQHSMVVGSFAKKIAKAEHYPLKEIDDAFVAGMLHDLGKLVLAIHLPERYDEKLTLIQEKGISHLEAEAQVFNGTHAEVGAYLIGLWGIADHITEAIALHHTPQLCSTKTFTLVTAVHIADVLGSEVYPSDLGIMPHADYHYIAELGLTERLSAWREICLSFDQKELTDG